MYLLDAYDNIHNYSPQPNSLTTKNTKVWSNEVKIYKTNLLIP